MVIPYLYIFRREEKTAFFGVRKMTGEKFGWKRENRISKKIYK